MKKIIAIIMVLVMVFAFCGCGKDKNTQNDGANSSSGQEMPPVSQDGVSNQEDNPTSSENQSASSQTDTTNSQTQTTTNSNGQQSSVQSQNQPSSSQVVNSSTTSNVTSSNKNPSSSTGSSASSNVSSQLGHISGNTSQKPSTPVKYANQVFSSARTYNKGQVAAKRDLSNTVYKLEKEKKLNIAYYGGSATVGTGATDPSKPWAAATTNWLKESYPDAQINAVNAAWGGTSTYWGLFRAERDLLPNKPDLVFIEFSVNDSYEGLNYSQSVYFMETLIQKINTELPETDIVLVFITDKGKIGQDFEEKAAHRDIAKHYGLPYIDAGQALFEEMTKSGRPITDYLVDYAHPNNEGYTIYANAVKEGLKKIMPNKVTAVKKHILPAKTYVKEGVNLDYKVLTADKINCGDTWEVGSRKIGNYTKLLKPLEKGASFSFDFEGNSLGVYAYIENLGNVKVTIDGKEAKLIDVPNPQGNAEQLLFDNLAEGTHNVKFEYIGTGRFYLCAIFIG